ncbi:MAG TPA: hypothetical protein VJ464_18010 [Blastocatellia bacterium]|nr:hypothetical protein [Blastocatellia bacterium]
MTNEQMERAIEFLLDHHAKMSADIERHSEQISQLTQVVGSLTGDVQALTGNIEAMREEMREGFNRLISANEQTTRLMEQLTMLEVKNSQRITGLERRVDDIEPRP